MAGYNKRSGSNGERRSNAYNDRSHGRTNSSRFGDRDRRPVEMHPAVCDACGANCEVPFRPSGSKPVHCRDCFRKGGSDFTPRQESAPGITSADLDEIHFKLDKIIQFLKIDEQQ